MSDLQHRLAALSPAQRALLELRLKKKNLSLDPTAHQPADPAARVAEILARPIPRRAATDRAPLSIDQERIYFINSFNPQSPFYNIYSVSRFRGNLDLGVMARIFTEIVRRHEILRTRFETIEGEPVQIVEPPFMATVPVIDYLALDPKDAQPEADRTVTLLLKMPFDLARLPLVRTAFLRLGEDDWIWPVTFHHIVIDWVSTFIFQREIGVLYQALTAGRPSPLPELPIQYADFALWQREVLTSEVLAPQAAYWREKLRAAPHTTELPIDHPRPAMQAGEGVRHPLALSAAGSAAARRLAQREGLTFFMFFLALFKTLAARLSGQDRVVIGSPLALRNHKDVEGLIGFFINQLVLYTDLSGDPEFLEILRRVRRTSFEAFAAKDTPFGQVVELVGPERDLSRMPLTQLTFFFLDTQQFDVVALPITYVPYRFDGESSKFDVTLVLYDRPEAFDGLIEYNADLFDDSTIERYARSLDNLLTSAMAEPRRRLSQLEILSLAERHQLLAEHGDPSSVHAELVPELFLRRAAAIPDAVAVVFGEEVLSYGELERRSAGFARRLAALGVKTTETLVGVALERSLLLPEVLLGIWRAGGAYLPLDPAYPSERLTFMVEDARLRWLVAETVAEWCPAGVETIAPAGIATGAARSQDLHAAGLAYVLYTSGSTGRPKGVAVPHAALANFLASMADRPGLGAGEALLAVTSLSFDIAGLELYLPLITGARIELVSREEAGDGRQLRARLERARAGVLQATPSTWQLLLAAGWEGDPRLRALCGGEALPRELAGELLGRVGELWNLYGPTETTVWSSRERVGGERITLGRPIAATQIHLLDRHLGLVALGAAGEPWIGGAGVARGYLGRPGLTAERFAPDPWGAPGARLYRTGDLARRRADGRIEFLGRIDHQVKLRGFRIELGEIETQLARQPGVAQAVAVLRPEGEGALVAFIVPVEGTTPTPEALRAGLLERLPAYMVPAFFVLLDAFPLTPNRKIDRGALTRRAAAPELAGAQTRSRVPPRTPTEQSLAAIWSELLGVGEIGVGDSFFELGGHSLLAGRVLARVRRELGVELHVRSVFDAPTLELLAAAVERARRQEDRELAPPLAPAARDGGGLPLSFAQERLWFLEQLAPGHATYNMPAALRLGGALDIAALAGAFSKVVQRHETLRTTFAVEGGVARQLISAWTAWTPWTLPLVDLSCLKEKEKVLQRLADAEAARPFDLARGPLLRVWLARSGPDEHLLLVTMHHIVSDAWSLGVLLREIATLYPAFSERRAAALPELPVQYADWAAWQRSWLAGEVLERRLEVWRRRLAGVSPLELPTDRPRRGDAGGRGGLIPAAIDPETTAGLLQAARAAGTTLYAVLVSSLAALLGWLSGQDEVTVGVPLAGRGRLEVEDLIGFFINTVVLRLDLGKNAGAEPMLRELAARAQEALLEADANQDVPLERVVAGLQGGGPSLIRAVLALENVPMPALELPGLRLAPAQEIHTRTAKFELTWNLWQTAGGLEGALEYDADLFDATTARRWQRAFESVLRAAARPEKRLSDLRLLEASERHQLLAEWNDTASGWPRGSTLAEVFEAQAARAPEAIAAVAAETGAWLSYGELSRRARAVAAWLRTEGVSAETPVALFTERSLEMLAATLGILRAGGAYVPLDAGYPAERLALLLEDCGAPAVLAQRALLGRLPESPAQVLVLEEIGAGEAAPAPALGSETLAYVMYTSGSTGKPKGVAVCHRGVLRLAHEMQTAESFLQAAPISFDAATLEIWGPLAGGGRVVLAPAERLSLAELGELIERQRVSHAWLTAGLFHLMADSDLGSLRGLRRLLAGGDVLSPPHVEKALAALPATVLVNGYGPTENTTFTCCHAMRSSEPVGTAVPIGRPISATTVHLLDRDLRPVPIGVAGQLAAGGDGLARGYHRRPGLTAAVFVPDPASRGERLYLTGDLARRRADGVVEFFGRIDQQVKIRGFRIEPGEIETLLGRRAGVAMAAVVVQASGDERRLVGFVQPLPGARLDASELRAELGRRLPEFMVPAAIEVLDRLPLSPNGKVDRKALKTWVTSAPRAEFIAPRTPTEERLAGLWRELLGVERVGREDDFFELGGHSLLATRLLSRLRESFGVELPLRRVFETATLAALAAVIEKERGEAVLPPLVPQTRPAEGLPLSLAQERLWLAEQRAPGTARYNVPLAVRLDGALDREVLARALAEVIGRHETLRTRFASVAGRPVQVVEERVDFELVQAEASRPFDLARAPLLRAQLLQLGEREHALLLTLHHIVCDGWSLGVLVQEAAVLYEALRRGEPSPLPPLPIQYGDYALWQRGQLVGEALERQLGFWREQLAGAPEGLDLPVDRPRPAVPSFRGASREQRLGREAIEKLARRSGATLHMVLLAGFATFAHRLGGQRDLVLGVPVAGRDRLELEGLIGFLINTLAVRLTPAPDASFEVFLAQVKERTLAAYAHQDVPVEWGFEAVVQLLNAPVAEVELAELSLRPLAAAVEEVKFDLVLNFREVSEGLAAQWLYRTDLFDPTTIARWMGGLETLLAAAAAEPSMLLADLPLLTLAERQQLVHEWNQAQIWEPGSLVERFEAQVDRTPDGVAVSFEGEQLSYAELDRRANRVANGLGMRAGERVALRFERTLEMVVAIVGVLKAGTAYVPLDPSYPADRVAFALEDSQAEVLERLTFEASDERPRTTLSAHYPAYVIYTSGSTGKPKGVVVTHGNATRLFDATEAWFNFSSTDVWTLFHSYAFDFSVWELWGPLLYGGRLVVVPYATSRSPREFHALLAQERVTFLNQTPTAFRQLIGVDEGNLALREVVFGGEALETASLVPWLDRYGARPRLVNMYGITETTVHVTYRPITREDCAPGKGSRVGYAIPDLTLHVLDRRLQPQPLGVAGEIHVGGAGLAQGYLRRPGLTAERFIPDPFSGLPGARLYKAGDLARWRPDRDLEYLGRGDHQVKIRGFRIELGEIESALARHPRVAETVVVAREQRLVAYIVAQGEPPTIGELRDFLSQTLPEPMLPSALVVLDRLPTLPSGKVDRKTLPAPTGERPALSTDFVAPSSALELMLAGLYREVLRVEQVGIDDDFFELGGSSLSGAVLINRLQQELGEIVQVVVIFDHPSVRKLGEYVAREHPKAAERLFAIRPATTAEQIRVDAAKLAELRTLIVPLAPSSPGPKNPPAVFVLAPPRSGTTLLRVLLGGHPRLFSPPELELLGFETLAERSAAFAGRDRFWLEGAVRAVMAAAGCDADQATRQLEGWEAEGWTSKQLYAWLQEQIGERVLVDKTPSYALDPSILERAEAFFDQPRYLHLVRHPGGMIRSFEEAKLDQLFFRKPHGFSRRELAELIWTASQQNVLAFLEHVPKERQLRVIFEELVREPRRVLGEICVFLEIDFAEAMLDPYAETRRRMTDGPHAASRMLGDVKFHQHRRIDPAVADSWRSELDERSLGEPTWELARRLGYVPTTEGIVPVPRAASMPLSYAQERLWLLDRIEPGNVAYSMPFSVRFRGRLEIAVLERALSEVVRRHETLRTTFEATDDGPVQHIHAPAPAALPIFDLSQLDSAQREAERLARLDAATPFDLTTGPLLRAALLRTGEREHVLLLNLHHVISDGWSVRRLSEELAALYGAFLRGEPSPLAPLPVQYADYAVWQRRFLAGAAMAEQLGYWRRQLAGVSHGSELPTDRPRPAVRGHDGAAHPLVLTEELSQRVTQLARRRGTTLFNLLLAAFKVLVYRWSGESDVVVGTPVAGRTRPEVDGLIGIFLNSLVLRTDLSGNPSFLELLERLREVTRGAQAHQDVPFEKLLEELGVERDPSRTPLFQIFFNLFDLPGEPVELPGLAIEPVAAGEAPSKFDLTVYAGELAGRVRLTLVYNARLFSAERMAELAAQYELLLERVCAEPGVAIEEVSLVSERAAALLPDPTAGLDPSWRGAVQELISVQADRHPERIAVVDGEQAWTYGELEKMANRLAHRLRALGVKKGDAVAIYAHRSATLAWAVLGVLKAGGAFVCLDPAYPPAYLEAIVERAQAKVVLALEAAGELPAGLASRQVLRLPVWLACEDFLAEEPETPPEIEIGADDVAVLGFTSGSTGVPKGVVGRHGPLSHFLPWQSRRFGLDQDDRYTMLSGIAHDPLQRDLFTSLCTGATLCVPEPRRIFAAGYLARWAAEQRATVAHLTPAMGQLLAEAEEGASIPSLRWALLVGDVLTRGDVERLQELAPSLTCINLYGSTETQRAVAYHVAEEAEEDGRQVLPLGKGMEDVQLLVVNPAGRLCGIGEVGEVWMRSPHLSAGYLGDEALTRERFLLNPFTQRPGDRVYRTGDLGRYLPNGEAVFAGRADQQVKIRGFRIELGEVEAHVSRVPGVRQAVAVVNRRREPARLVAWVVGETSGEAVRAQLQERLPVHLVPSTVVVVEALPITPNGKVDRAELARREPPQPETERVAPTSDLERRLAGLWAETLALPAVGVLDNFFDLGGQSLLLVRLHRRIEAELGRPVPIVMLFQYPTVRAFAEQLERAAAPAEALGDARERARRQLEAARRQKERRGGR